THSCGAVFGTGRRDLSAAPARSAGVTGTGAVSASSSAKTIDLCPSLDEAATPYRQVPRMSLDRSPLAPERFPDLPVIAGVIPRVARARYKLWDRCDLTFVTLDQGTAVAGVLTNSRCPSPEVEWCRKALVLGRARALVVNAGNSNAFTGSRGRAAVEAVAARAAAHLGCEPSDVFVASTGGLGVPPPI